MISKEVETYVTRPSIRGKGIFSFTSICKNHMYYRFYVPKRWDNCICPKCGRVLKFEKEDISLSDVTL